MKDFWKYFLLSFIVVVSTIFYFLKTDIGHQNLGYLVENYLSKKTYNKIKVYSLNLESYPELIIELQVNDRANVTLKGKLDNYSIDMSYHLRGDSFYFNNIYLDDKIDVKGKLFGTFEELSVTGEGEIFNGVVDYKFVNTPKTVKKMVVNMSSVESSKVLAFLEEKAFINGLANINMKFKRYSSYSKDGVVKIHIDRATTPQLKSLSAVLNSTIYFQDMEYKYQGDITSDILGRVIFNNGTYHEFKHIAYVDYESHFKNLSYFEDILKFKYQGSLDLNGTLIYNTTHKDFIIKGSTKQFKGDFSFFYRENMVDFKLKRVSLLHILNQLDYPALFTSDIDGTININLKDEIVIVNTNLKNTRFLASKFSEILAKEREIDILSETYNQSCFSAGYQNLKLSSSLKIDNGKSYIKLFDTTIDTLTKKIDSKFEINMQGQQIYGEIYGDLKNPDFLIDKRRFIHHQTNKYISDLLGTE